MWTFKMKTNYPNDSVVSIICFLTTMKRIKQNYRYTFSRLEVGTRAVKAVLTKQITKQTNSVVWVRERKTPTERQQLVGKVSVNFWWYRVPRGQRYGSLGRILDFLDRSRYFFFQAAPQLYWRGWVDPPLLRKSGSAKNWIRASVSVARNSDH
jgi:hypothetical protein